MSYQEKLKKIFHTNQPIMGMLHLKGDTDQEIFDRAIREIKLYTENGVHAVVVENYFGKTKHVEMVLEYLYKNHPDIVYGVNVLDDDQLGFELANKYHAKFIQLDSVAGHLTIEEDKKFHQFITEHRKNSNALVLGGVRFKYQPYKSGRTLEEDLTIGMTRCDGIVVTSETTSQETDINKIKSFKEIIGDFPLFVGAGITPKNIATQFQIVDGGVVGSYFKDTGKDTGDVSVEKIKEFMAIYQTL